MKLKKRQTLMTAIFLLIGFIAIAQTPPTLDEIGDAIEDATTPIFNIVNTIIGIILFMGAANVIITLVGKKEASKLAIIGWIGGFIIWGLANLLLIG